MSASTNTKFDELLHLEGGKCTVTTSFDHNVKMVNIFTVHIELFLEKLEW